MAALQLLDFPLRKRGAVFRARFKPNEAKDAALDRGDAGARGELATDLGKRQHLVDIVFGHGAVPNVVTVARQRRVTTLPNKTQRVYTAWVSG
jgi:hypothetical protein